MNAAVNAALIAAAAQKEQASEALLKQFQDKQAFGPANAIALEVEDGPQQQALDEMQGLGVIRPVGTGRYYLDRERQTERKQEQGRIALLVLAGVVSILASVITLLALT